jgi:hypothetical protein
MMRRMVIGACALGALACASSSGGDTAQAGAQNLGTIQGNRAVTVGANSGQSQNMVGATEIVTAPDRSVVATVPASLDMAFAAIVSGYSGIKIQVLTADSRSYVLGNTLVRASGTMLGQPLSRFFDCGKSGLTGMPRANDYHVTFSILSSLSRVDSATTRVTTAISATAADPSTSGTDVHCASTGALERALLSASGYSAK